MRKSIDFVGFLGGFSVFLLCCGYWNRYGLYADCKNWKEKVFVLRMYFCMYMFLFVFWNVWGCCNRKEKLYQMQNWKQAAENGIEKHIFIIENAFVLNVKKLYNITLGMVSPYFTYKKRKCVRPQLTWGSSLPQWLFLDLEITFSFAHSFLPLFSLFLPLLYSLFLSFSSILFYLLFTLPPFHSFI